MQDFGFIEMQEIQKQLQEKYKDKWVSLSPELGKEQLLWLMIELGEVADVMMYFNDVMLCYGISVEELKEIYLDKHQKNMERW